MSVWDWFKFGVVRGALGLVIGGIILGGLHNAGVVQGCGLMSFVANAGILSALILAIPIVLLVNGAQYAIGSKIVEWLELHSRGYKAVLLVAVVGITIFSVLISIPVLLILGAITGKPLVLGFFLGLPMVIGIEAIMATLTYGLYVFAKDVLEINAVESLSV